MFIDIFLNFWPKNTYMWYINFKFVRRKIELIGITEAEYVFMLEAGEALCIYSHCSDFS